MGPICGPVACVWHCALLLLVVDLAHGCTPTVDWTRPTDERQARAASVVVVANVTEVIPPINTSDPWLSPHTVRATAVQYLKGCGPEEVVITGFTGSSVCGVAAPAVGSQAVFFLCASSTNASDQTFELNTEGDIHLGLGRLDGGLSEFVKAVAAVGATPSAPSNKTCPLTHCVAYQPEGSPGLRLVPALVLLAVLLVFDAAIIMPERSA